MSSGKASGGANASHDYYGTVLGIGGVGQITGIFAILQDGNQVYGSSGPLMYNPSGGVGDLYSITIPGLGTVQVLWGTETQNAGSVLTAEDNPPYRGYWGLILNNVLFGTERQTPPNIEIIPLGVPQQSIVTGTPATLDSNYQANAAAVAAEYATAWHGLQLTSSQINTTSFQTVANDLSTDTFLNQLAPCSPLLSDLRAARDSFAELQSLADLWFRFDVTGKLEMGRWKRSGPVGSVTIITANEWTTPPKDNTDDITQIPNTFDIIFNDKTQLFSQSTQPVHDIRAMRLGAQPKRQQLQCPMITAAAQAQLHGQEAVRLQGNPTISGSVVVRPTKAVNPDATPIRPGDYFELDITQNVGGTGSLQLCRCTGRSFDAESAITLEYEFDPSPAPITYQVAYTDSPITPDVIGPIVYARFISPNTEPFADPAVYCLPMRSHPLVTGVQVAFDTSSGSTYAVIGSQVGCALPCSLHSSVGASDTTINVDVTTLWGGTLPGNLDVHYLTDAIGVSSDSAARNNELLLILVSKDHTTGAQLMSGQIPWMEICSIQDVAVVSSNTYALTVLRGRMDTNAQDFDTQAGTVSFPDAFLYYEAWVIPRSLLTPLYHNDFASLVSSAGTGYFELAPFSSKAIYDPASAFAAGLQSSASWTIWSYQFRVAAPIAPTGVTATAGTGHIIKVAWNALPSPVDNYLIFRATGPGYTDEAQIGETSEAFYYDDAPTSSITYRYRVQAQNVDDQTSAFSSSATATSGTLGASLPGAPASPTAMTLAGSDHYMSADGNVMCYMDFNVPSLPTNAIATNILIGLLNDSTKAKLVGQSVNTSGTVTVRVSELVPGAVYYAWSRATGAGGSSADVAATSSPFTAPVKTTGPNPPQSPSMISPATSGSNIPASVIGGVVLYAAQARWLPPTDTDIDHYVIWSANVNDPTSTVYTWQSPVATKELFYNLYSFSLNHGYTFVQAVNKSGVAGTTAECGDALSYAYLPVGTVAQYNDTGLNVTGIKTGGSSSVLVTARVSGNTTSVTLTGGVLTESHNLALASGLSYKADAGNVDVVDGTFAGSIFVAPNWDSGSNNATTQTIVFRSLNGSNLPAATIRIQYEFVNKT